MDFWKLRPIFTNAMPRAPRKKPSRPVPYTTDSNKAEKSTSPSKREKEVLPVLTQLTSATSTAEDRVWACAALSHLLSNPDPSVRRLLGSHKVVDLLIAKANVHGEEKDVGVRAEALGALRNYAVEAGQEVCAEVCPFYPPDFLSGL